MRSTAIIHVTRNELRTAHNFSVRGDVWFTARCQDCGDIRSSDIRKELEELWVKPHRRECSQRPGVHT